MHRALNQAKKNEVNSHIDEGLAQLDEACFTCDEPTAYEIRKERHNKSVQHNPKTIEDVIGLEEDTRQQDKRKE
jgi:hypothetical protein